MSSIVLFAGDAERTCAFYRALGVPPEAEDPDGRAVEISQRDHCTP